MLTACIVPFSGKFGKVWVEVKNSNGINKSVQPRLLQQGEHFIDSYLFQFVVGMVDVATTYISHGSIHRISVDKGKVAKVWHDNLPRLLGEGDHIVESTQFRFEGMESIIANPCIVHGTLAILRVTRGQIALVWKDNEPTFIDIPGLYEFDSPDFTFAEFKDAEEPCIQLGSKKTIIVQTGQVGVTYLEGQLKILPNGRHVIDLATHIFNHFLSTQQKSIREAGTQTQCIQDFARQGKGLESFRETRAPRCGPHHLRNQGLGQGRLASRCLL
jgi:hypothetical protein